MSDELILVDIYDHQIGSGEKLWTHEHDRLHRAFSVFVVCDGNMLIQQRAFGKYHSGGLWANACCSHPRNGESLTEAVPRRLQEELGTTALHAEEKFSFIYRTEYDSGLTEYEYDHVFLAECSPACKEAGFRPNPEEIAALCWISFEDLARELVERPQQFTSWFLIAAPRVLKLLQNEK